MLSEVLCSPTDFAATDFFFAGTSMTGIIAPPPRLLEVLAAGCGMKIRRVSLLTERLLVKTSRSPWEELELQQPSSSQGEQPSSVQVSKRNSSTS